MLKLICKSLVLVKNKNKRNVLFLRLSFTDGPLGKYAKIPHLQFLTYVAFSSLALYDLAVLKKKVKEKEEKKKKKIKMIKSETEDLAEPLSSTEGIPPLSQAASPLAVPAIKEE